MIYVHTYLFNNFAILMISIEMEHALMLYSKL
jgi:hypothetical protein